MYVEFSYVSSSLEQSVVLIISPARQLIYLHLNYFSPTSLWSKWVVLHTLHTQQYNPIHYLHHHLRQLPQVVGVELAPVESDGPYEVETRDQAAEAGVFQDLSDQISD